MRCLASALLLLPPLVGAPRVSVGARGNEVEHSSADVNQIDLRASKPDDKCAWGEKEHQQMLLQLEGKCLDKSAKRGTARCPIFVQAKGGAGDTIYLKLWERKDTRDMNELDILAGKGTKIYMAHPCSSGPHAKGMWIDEIPPNTLADSAQLNNQFAFHGYSGKWRIVEYSGTWRKIPEAVVGDVPMFDALPAPKDYAGPESLPRFA
jgi:hypothetical protein